MQLDTEGAEGRILVQLKDWLGKHKPTILLSMVSLRLCRFHSRGLSLLSAAALRAQRCAAMSCTCRLSACLQHVFLYPEDSAIHEKIKEVLYSYKTLLLASNGEPIDRAAFSVAGWCR